MDLKYVIELDFSEKRMQESTSLINIKEAFAKNIVMVPELWNVLLEVSFSFGAVESEMGVHYFSSDGVGSSSVEVEVTVGLSVGVTLKRVPADK